MNHEESHKPAEPRDASSAGAQTEQGAPESAAAEETVSPLPRVEYSESAVASVRQTEICQEEEKAVPLPQFDNPETTETEQQQIGRDEMPSSLVVREPESSGSTPSLAAEPVPAPKANSFFREQNPQMIEVAPHVLRHWTRRDVLLFGAGALATLAGGGSLLPQTTLERLGIIPLR